ncbi:HAD family hydrolase [Nakamurella sp.]|uniref:HAD family hydrolase n=1 Tax=Nakamurella sp. TaxID=1869182 RepID=UPI003783E647
MPEPGVRTVLFDVDDTLVDFAGAARAALAEVVVAALGGDPASTPGAGAGADEDLVAAAQHAWQQVSEHEYSRFTAGELDFDQMRLSRMSAFLRTIDRPGARRLDHELMEQRRNEAIFGHFRLFDDVPAALHRLRAAGIAVRVLSNSDGAYQRAKLTAVGLGDLAADGFFSGELGVAKPDPRIFTLAAARLGRAPAEVAYVGDRWEVDVLGSLAAGMASVWLNRAGADRPDGQRATGPVAQIATLDELVVAGGGLHLG